MKSTLIAAAVIGGSALALTASAPANAMPRRDRRLLPSPLAPGRLVPQLRLVRRSRVLRNAALFRSEVQVRRPEARLVSAASASRDASRHCERLGWVERPRLERNASTSRPRNPSSRVLPHCFAVPRHCDKRSDEHSSAGGVERQWLCSVGWVTCHCDRGARCAGTKTGVWQRPLGGCSDFDSDDGPLAVVA